MCECVGVCVHEGVEGGVGGMRWRGTGEGNREGEEGENKQEISTYCS